MRDICIIGESGSGKDTLANSLIEDKGYTHVSLSETLRALARAQFPDKESLSRKELSQYADALRRSHGTTYLLDSSVDGVASPIAVSGVYARLEAEAFRKRGGIVVAVVAPPELRYERIKARGEFRDAAFSTYEEFLAQATKELGAGGYEGRISLQDADHILTNDTSYAAFKVAVSHLLSEVVDR